MKRLFSFFIFFMITSLSMTTLFASNYEKNYKIIKKEKVTLESFTSKPNKSIQSYYSGSGTIPIGISRNGPPGMTIQYNEEETYTINDYTNNNLSHYFGFKIQKSYIQKFQYSYTIPEMFNNKKVKKAIITSWICFHSYNYSYHKNTGCINKPIRIEYIVTYIYQ